VEYVVPVVSVLVGALVGISVVLLAELWKAVLEFQIGARVVRAELFRNRALLSAAYDNPGDTSTNFVDANWQDFGSKLAFLMEEREWRIVALHYTHLSNLKYDIEKEISVDLEFVEALLTDMTLVLEILDLTVKRGRFGMLCDAFRSRTPSVLLPNLYEADREQSR
jgi:hypothetical protein